MDGRSKLTVGTWIAIVTLMLSIGGVCSGVMFKVFASKDAVHKVELKQARGDGTDNLQQWRIETIETKVDNMQVQQTRIDLNVVKLLARFRVAAEPSPTFKSLPTAPRPIEE